MAFDNDEILDDDDEDLKNDPVSQMDMQVSRRLLQSYLLPEGVFEGPSRFFPTKLCNPQYNQFLRSCGSADCTGDACCSSGCERVVTGYCNTISF